MTLKKRRIILIISIAVFLLGALIICFYSQGYILDKEWRISKRGGLYAYIPHTNAKVYVNNEEKETSGFLKTSLFLPRLKPGDYTIISAKDGYWPWTKTIKVKEGYVTETRAMMLPLDPKGEIVLRGKLINIFNSPYQKIIALTETEKNGNLKLNFYLPDKNNFLLEKSPETKNLLTFSSQIEDIIWGENYLIFKTGKYYIKAEFNLSEQNISASYTNPPENPELDYKHERTTNAKDQKIWWDPETNEIFIDWIKEDSQKPPYYICPGEICSLPISIFGSKYKIRNIDFFPGRKDLIVIAVSNAVYALEIDGRGQRMLQPVYKGKNPNFAVVNRENNIWILDDGVLIKINFEN